MECKEQDCTRKIKYKAAGQCNWHYERAKSLATLDQMLVRPCLGGCGIRVHNKASLIVPGITQGHGPKRAYCSTCAAKRVPEPHEARFQKYRGQCRRCDREMQAGAPEEGFVRHQARGLCTSCYNHFYAPRDVDKVKKLRTLNPQKVAKIKRLLLDGMPQYKVAEAFGVSKDQVYNINKGNTWKNVKASV